MTKTSGLSPFEFHLDPVRDNYAVMGNPVAHSKSPRIHADFARQTSQPISYQAIQVPIDGFAAAVQYFRNAGGRGLNITVPFKEEAFKLCARLSASAMRAGAVNTISITPDGQLDGDNTDGVGLLRDLENNHVSVTGRQVLILGAGGAVRGVLGPLLEKRPAHLLLANRTLARAENLVREHAGFRNLAACPLESIGSAGRFDLVINATSSGLHGELPALPEHLLADQACCYDMVYGDAEPVFVRWAKQHGASLALDGLGMLIEQAAESFYIWRGVRPDTAPVIAMLRAETSEV